MLSEAEIIARAQNVATNGRTFCILLFAACIAVYLVTKDSAYVPLAVVAALPVGLSYLGELPLFASFRNVIAVLNVVIAAAVMIVLYTV